MLGVALPVAQSHAELAHRDVLGVVPPDLLRRPTLVLEEAVSLELARLASILTDVALAGDVLLKDDPYLLDDLTRCLQIAQLVESEEALPQDQIYVFV